jgi:hypothetical protein
VSACDEQGHHLNYLTGRCSRCGEDEDTIVSKRESRKLRDAKAAAKPVPVKLKGIVGSR